MRKKVIKIIAMLLCMMIPGSLLTGCENVHNSPEHQSEPVHAALVLQPVSTVPVINAKGAKDLLKDVCRIPGSSVSIIIADGEPWEYASVQPDEIDSSYSSSMQEKIIEERVTELLGVIASAAAVNPESNLIGGIERAAREIQSYPSGDKELIIFGSCINTVSPLPMQDMVLSSMDTDAVIENLKDDSYLADLEGVNVTVFNLGDTCGDQKDLSNLDKKNLRNFYMKYFKESHAAEISFKTDLPSELTYENLPKVSTVPVVKTYSVIEPLQEDGEIEIETVDAVSFDEKSIAFNPGTAELKNPDAASKAISEVAEYMLNSDVEALLVGSTAKWGALSDSITLSYERATVIRSLFVQAGVDENRFTVIGSGWLSCFYQNDEGPNGELNEEVAPFNRACIWINTSGDLADKVWNDEDFHEFMLED